MSEVLWWGKLSDAQKVGVRLPADCMTRTSHERSHEEYEVLLKCFRDVEMHL